MKHFIIPGALVVASLLFACGRDVQTSSTTATTEDAAPVERPAAKPVEPEGEADEESGDGDDVVVATSRSPETYHAAEGAFPLTFEQTEFDLGEIDDTHEVSQVISFVNDGDTPVNVLSVKGTCGCVVPALNKNVYAPGESGTLEVKFRPHGRQGKQVKPIKMKVESEGRRFEAQIIVKSDIFPMIGWQPVAVFLGNVERGEQSEFKHVTVTSRLPDFQILEHSISDDRFDYRYLGRKTAMVRGEEVTQDEFEIRFLGDPEIQQIRPYLVLKTNYELRPEVRIRAIVDVIGPLFTSPNRIQVVANPDERFTKRIMLRHRANGMFKVLGTSIEADRLEQLEVKQSEETKHGIRSVYFDISGFPAKVDRTTGNTIKGMLKIRTDLVDQPEVKVEITGHVRLQAKRD